MHPRALLEACAELVGLVLKFDHPADQVVSRYFREHRELGPRERSTLAETVYTVLRKKLLFDHLSPSGSGPKERRMAILGFHGPRDFLKSALGDAEKRWLDQCDAVKPEDLLERHRHNLPEWLVAPLKAQLGEGFWPLVRSLQQPAPLDLRVNALTDKRPDVQKELGLAGIPAAATPFSPWGLRVEGKPALAKLDAFARGAVEVQDEGSQLLALLTDARRGQMVVDFCAGAGGKTLALGAAMRNTGRLYAFDTSGHRLASLKPRLARSGLSNVYPVQIAHERDERIKRLAGKLDRVLVDAPCSGLGTLRRNPDLKWRQSPQSVEELRIKQAAILASAARLLKPGGRLVYATCSLLDAENEVIAQAFSTERALDFAPLPAQTLLDKAHVAQAETLVRGDFLRLWPHLHGTDGFFAAAWERR
jgi:16S rRNA (cytosine967-C5)-methyltransferase